MKIKHWLLLFAVLLLTRFTEAQEVIIDGKINKKEWSKATNIGGLYAPWEDQIKKDHTTIQYFIKDGWLFFYFIVKDTTMQYEPYINERSVAKSDRVELFFSKNKDLKKYYCFEIDIKGNKLDYRASYHRIFDRSWDYTKIRTASTIIEDQYIVEGAIYINDLDIFRSNNKSFYMAIFRADYGPQKQQIWYSAKKIRNKQPDFHIPQPFFKVKTSKFKL
ncbi:hypothetical protein K5X82_01340 [Halosquirtibacter xylanolyticus]|uniref:sugar-binding protein n=1 Tax=Halosquirtibacter xylanolyticus TaxID=3374599 RepID=UPI003748B1F5|nr:hypothetical protein K5X82_01340 [Prolixibacteraceae bacterium]